jgi:1-pyrroline-5-carboxylate dehydrogenase
LFVPLLAVALVSDFDEAIARTNAVEYGLTAGIFSAEAAEIARFFDEVEAGVCYANKRSGATTGAWPGAQSFTGWKASGSTGKGGCGPYYVAQFMREQSRTVIGS